MDLGARSTNISFDNISDFNITTLPIGVFDLFAQAANTNLVSKYLSWVLIFSMFSRLLVNQRPRILNFGGFQDIFRWGSHLAFELLSLPSHTLFVLSWLSFSPETLPKRSRWLNSFSNDCLSPFKRNVVSSANWLTLSSVSSILIGLISWSSLILHARISAHKINKYGEIGSPWRHPRSILKLVEACPLTRIEDLMSL